MLLQPPPKRGRCEWADGAGERRGARDRRDRPDRPDIDAQPADGASGGWLSALEDAARSRFANREGEGEGEGEGEEERGEMHREQHGEMQMEREGMQGTRAEGEEGERMDEDEDEDDDDDERDERRDADDDDDDDGDDDGGDNDDHGDDDDGNDGVINEQGDMGGELSDGEVDGNVPPPNSPGDTPRDKTGSTSNETRQGQGGQSVQNGAMEVEHTNGTSNPITSNTPNGTTSIRASTPSSAPRTNNNNNNNNNNNRNNNADDDLADINDGGGELDETTLQACIEQYGLIIVERDATTRAITWLCCKLCAVFGRRRENASVKKLQCYTAPFYRSKFTQHLTSEHGSLWRRFMRCTAEEKRCYFKGFDVTPGELRKRVQAAKRARAATEHAPREHTREKVRRARRLMQRLIPGGGVLYTTRRDWTGRTTWRDDDGGNIVAWMGTKWGRYGRFRWKYARKCVHEMEIEGRVAGLVLQGPFQYGHTRDVADDGSDGGGGIVDTVEVHGECVRAMSVIFRETSHRTACILSLLARGVGMRMCVDMLLLAGEAQRVRSGDETEEGEIATECESGSDDGTPRKRVQREVEAVANAAMALGLELLKRVLNRNWLNWAVALKCEARYGGVQVCVSTVDEYANRHWMHLICVFGSADVGEVVAVLNCVCENWRVRLLGIQSGIENGSKLKPVEEAILKMLRREGGRDDMCVVERQDRVVNRACFPWTLARMGKEEFERLVKCNECALGMALGKARLKALYLQQDYLLSADVCVKAGLEEVALDQAWKMQREEVRECEVLARGLANLWVSGGKWAGDEEMVVREEEGDGGARKRKKGKRKDEVDASLERVLWARQAVKLWRLCAPNDNAGSAFL